MVRKLALTSLFFSSNVDTSSSLSLCSPPSMSASSSTATSWQWPSCTQPRTLSFSRDDSAGLSMRRHFHHINKHDEDHSTGMMMNPAYLLDSAEHSGLSNASAPAVVGMSGTGSLPPAAAGDEVDEVKVITRGLRSNRLFFEPSTTTSSIVKGGATAAFDGATAMAIDSDDPYGDFRRSMEEMVMSHGFDDWGWLEEMLGWYLKANGKNTHGLIVGAFVDLLVALTSPPSPACSSSFMALQLINKGKHEHKQGDQC